jgi:hypothetical protein
MACDKAHDVPTAMDGPAGQAGSAMELRCAASANNCLQNSLCVIVSAFLISE